MDWLGGILLGAIISYALDFTKPWVTAFFTKGSLSIREKRLSSLLREYKAAKRMRNDRFRYIAILLIHLMAMVGASLIAILAVGTMVLEGFYRQHEDTNSLYWNGMIFSVLITALLFSILLSVLDYSTRVNQPEKYREKTVAKIKKLGGNPEELDTIDRI